LLRAGFRIAPNFFGGFSAEWFFCFLGRLGDRVIRFGVFFFASDVPRSFFYGVPLYIPFLGFSPIRLFSWSCSLLPTPAIRMRLSPYESFFFVFAFLGAIEIHSCFLLPLFTFPLSCPTGLGCQPPLELLVLLRSWALGLLCPFLLFFPVSRRLNHRLICPEFLPPSLIFLPLFL